MRRVRLKCGSRGGEMDYGFPLCARNKRGLATDSRNLAKIHLIETRPVIKSSVASVIRKKRVKK
jgi:hypothetical protein